MQITYLWDFLNNTIDENKLGYFNSLIPELARLSAPPSPQDECDRVAVCLRFSLLFSVSAS